MTAMEKEIQTMQEVTDQLVIMKADQDNEHYDCLESQKSIVSILYEVVIEIANKCRGRPYSIKRRTLQLGKRTK